MTSIITAILIISVAGAIGSVILVAASALFEVKEDPRAEQITELLPGANCGSCGYAGCADYAKAVAEGRADVNCCIPGGQKTAEGIAAIMGVEAGKVESYKAFVTCQGSYLHTTDKYDYEGIESCAACNTLYSGRSSCRFGCLGYGDCKNVCKFDAIIVENGVSRINREKCTGCGACAKACPDGIIVMLPVNEQPTVMCANREKGAATRKICDKGCIGCMKCEKACPAGAVKVENNVAKIDIEKCVACHQCVEVCPVGVIHVPPKSGESFDEVAD